MNSPQCGRGVKQHFRAFDCGRMKSGALAANVSRQIGCRSAFRKTERLKPECRHWSAVCRRRELSAQLCETSAFFAQSGIGRLDALGVQPKMAPLAATTGGILTTT